MCSCAYRISILELAEVKLRAEFQQYADRRTVLSNGTMWFIRHQVRPPMEDNGHWHAGTHAAIPTDRPNVSAVFQLHA
jgi:hypothetical protein